MPLTCPACRNENPDTARFCNACGSALNQICAGCSQTNPPDARFCNGCGSPLAGEAAAPAPREYTPRHLADKILSQRSAIEGERKGRYPEGTRPDWVTGAEAPENGPVTIALGGEKEVRLLPGNVTEIDVPDALWDLVLKLSG